MPAYTQDARIATSLPSHPKTKKLIRRLGHEGGWYLVCLFLWAAGNRPDGNLSGMTDEDIELSVNWTGDDGDFVKAMCSVGFLDGKEGERSIHDWSDHNPWASGAKDRSEKARYAAFTMRYGKDEAARRMPEYAQSKQLAELKPASSSALGLSPVSVSVSASDSVSSPTSERDTREPVEISGEVCVKLRAAGIVRLNPMHADLIAAIAEGVPSRSLIATVLEGRDAGKGDPFSWGIATARNRHKQGPTPVNGNSHAAHQPGRKLSAVEQVEQAIRDRRAAEGGDDDAPNQPRIAG